MSVLSIGCGPLPERKRGALPLFGCGEVLEAVQEPVRHNTLRRWAQEAVPNFAFFVGAWRWIAVEPLDEKRPAPLELSRKEVGLFRPTAANAQLWAEVVAQANACSARGVLLRSPPAFTPSATNLDNLRRFRAEIIGETCLELVWEPRGIWQREELLALGEELGFTIAIDPHLDARLPDAIDGPAYYTVTAPPGRLRFSEDDLYDLTEFCAAHEGEVRVMFRGPDRETNARAFARAAGIEAAG
ncbi:MAG: DUF72 domain-containing protein [Myxococcales bacterium]|nr:DUF72 domain-containing protein [Myxococcales bacterium]